MKKPSPQLFLTFSRLDGSDPKEFSWEVEATELGVLWFNELGHALERSDTVHEQRFFGWNHGEEDRRRLVQRLNESIDLINAHFGEAYQIPERAFLGMGQDLLNVLHHHFECLMGQSWNRSPLVLNAPTPAQVAVRWLNDFLHDYEYSDNPENYLNKGHLWLRGFQFQLVPYRQLPLNENHLKSFTFENTPGDIVTSYCQLGKTWVEAFINEDEVIHLENISPLRYFASSFVCNFHEFKKVPADDLTVRLREYIVRKLGPGTDPHDPRHALGHARLARLSPSSLLREWSVGEVTDFFRAHPVVSCMRLLGPKGEMRREFRDPDSYYGHSSGEARAASP